MVTSFLLKKRINPTLTHQYRISKKKKQPPYITMRIHHFNMKLLKPLITLPHSNIPDAALKN
jgi:hypothetical protein